jgi:uncharacterized protein (TIRG00374 family)
MKTLKFSLSILIGLAFGVWALWQVDFGQMWTSLQGASYFYLFPVLGLLFLSHWFRALRWQLLLRPVAQFRRTDLFSALLIGYMANTVMPAHLGEFIRAYIAGKSEDVPSAQIFSSIVVERLLDLAFFLALTALAMFFFPFPAWIVHGGYFIFLFTGIFACSLFFKNLKSIQTWQFFEKILKPVPEKIRGRLLDTAKNFLTGFGRLKDRGEYFRVFLYSILIWLAYGAIFRLGFEMMHLHSYHLNWISALVLLVISTIGVIVPNAPGYVGTYHKLCQFGLGLFGVPVSVGMGFAIVLHAVNFLPVILAGLVLMGLQGWSLRKISADAAREQKL